MRFFLSCQQALKKHSIPAYSFWETYFKMGLEEAGHEWVEARNVDWAEGLVYTKTEDLNKWRERTWSRTVDYIKQQHQQQPINLFLSYLFPKQVEPGAIREIQDLGIPCVNFFCDNVRDFNRIPKSFFCFDLHWVPEFKALKMYQEAKLNYIYAPMPVWIDPARRKGSHSESYGITFIGSRDIQRENLLAKVLKSDIPIEIRGSGWLSNSDLGLGLKTTNPIHTAAINQWNFLTQYGFLPWMRKLRAKSHVTLADSIFSPFVKTQPDAEEYIDIIQQSQITIGINRYPSFYHPFNQPDTYSRMRDIEAPMMGACYLTEWTEGLDDLYDLGEEIETYQTAEELIEKILSLQQNMSKRQRMRQLAQKRALTQHSITNSINIITSSLNLPSTANLI